MKPLLGLALNVAAFLVVVAVLIAVVQPGVVTDLIPAATPTATVVVSAPRATPLPLPREIESLGWRMFPECHERSCVYRTGSVVTLGQLIDLLGPPDYAFAWSVYMDMDAGEPDFNVVAFFVQHGIEVSTYRMREQNTTDATPDMRIIFLRVTAARTWRDLKLATELEAESLPYVIDVQPWTGFGPVKPLQKRWP